MKKEHADKIERVLSKIDHYTSLKGRMNHIIHRFLRYSLIGVPAFLIDLLILWFLTSNGLFYLYSLLISFTIAHSFNYTINKHWTFRDSKIPFFNGYYRFLLFGALSLGLTEGIMFALTSVSGVYYLTSRVIVAIVVSMLNFALNYRLTFDAKKPSLKR